jgi:hypothetical protein
MKSVIIAGRVEFLTILEPVPYRFRNISRTVIVPVNSNKDIVLRYFEAIVTESGLAAV